MEGVNTAYNIAGGLRLTGQLDLTALRLALNRIIARHEILRTTFILRNDQPVQNIAPETCGFELLEHDLRQHPQAEEVLLQIGKEEAGTGFDLAEGPLIRGRLISLDETEHVLLMTMHHIISDGWSMGVLTNELTHLYCAYQQGEKDPLPPLAIQYADYAAWQHQFLAGDILKSQSDYWQRTLADAPSFLELPTDRHRPAEQDYTGAFIRMELDEHLTTSLKILSKRHGVTLFMTLMTGWAALLSRLSGQTDLVIGTPVANRTRAELDPLVGFFVNTLALRLDLSGNPTITRMIERVKAQALDAQGHQNLPFEQVVEIVKPMRSLSHSPIFQVMFAWNNNDAGTIDLPELSLSPIALPHTIAKFDLTLNLSEAGEKITGGIEYATSLFDRTTIARYLGYLQNILQAMVADDQQVLHNLEILDPAERQQLLVEWNATETPYPKDKCIHEIFEDQATLNPDAIAVVQDDGVLSYGELNSKANRLAYYLRNIGVKPDTRVAICVERSPEMVIGVLAIMKAGGAYVPIDLSYPTERIAYMLEDCAPVVVLTHGQIDEPIQACLASGQRTMIDLKKDGGRWEDLPAGNPDLAGIGLTPGHLAYVIYTSGSTGMPKGVMVEHHAVVRLVKNTTYIDFTKKQVFLAFAPLSFDASTFELWGALLNGHKLVIPHSIRDAIDELGSMIEKYKVTTLWLTAGLFNVMVDHHLPELKGLTQLLTGGDILSPDHCRRFKDAYPDIRLVNGYGPTENTTFTCCYTLPNELSHSSVPIGRPISNTKVYILDTHGRPVPIGVTGEIFISGAGVARGYLNRPELTEERFISDPFSTEPGARMYKTGDLARYLPDGNIEFSGRNDFQVKIRGFRIELGEIEKRLSEYPGIRETAVLAREVVPGDKRLIVYYTTDPDDNTIQTEQLRAHLTELLPEYMVPAAYVSLPEFPLTRNGKLDRNALPEPDGMAYTTRGYEAPQGDIETRLAKIWAELLQLDRVGLHDNFFELGGHSLLAVSMISRMREEGLFADVRDIFTTDTLSKFATIVSGTSGIIDVPDNLIPKECTEIRPDMLPLIQITQKEINGIIERVPGGLKNIQDIYPLAPLQEGILFHHMMTTKSDPYLLYTLLGFDRRTSLDTFLTALRSVIERHDILRTAVLWEGLSEPVQVVLRKAPLIIEEILLDPSDGDIAEQLSTRFNPRHFRLDVRQAPMMRAVIAYDAVKNRWVMLFLFHHLVMDHTTLEVLQQEVLSLVLGQTDPLPEPLPYRNYVAQTRLGVSREAHEDFFKKLLGDVDEPTAPFGLIDVRGDGSGILEARLAVDDQLAKRLRKNASTLGVSAASLCHLAWAQVLGRVSGRDDVVFGTVLFGRMQGAAGSDRMPGLFINTLPVRIRLNEDNVKESVLKTHALLAELMHHEHATLSLAQRCSAVAPPAPLFSALLNYRHSNSHQVSHEAEHSFGGIESLGGEERTNYPFTLSVDDLGKGFSLTAQVQASINPQRVCGFMHTALESLVHALESEPTIAMWKLDILNKTERHQMMVEWNSTEIPYPKGKCLHELFENKVNAYPESLAVVQDEKKLSYAELNTKANRLAHYLRNLGVKPDTRVAICLKRSPEMIIGVMAVLKAGGAYVPIDPSYPADRILTMSEDCKPLVALTHGQVDDSVRIYLASGVTADCTIIDMDTDAFQWENEPETNPDRSGVGLTPNHLAYVIYTSGSTGKPKGVMVEHRGIANLVIAQRRGLGVEPDSRILQAASFSFDVCVFDIVMALCNGAALFLPAEGNLLAGEGLTQTIKKYHITHATLTPAALAALPEHADIDPVQTLIVAGEAFTSALVKRWAKGRRLINGYGPTEITIWATMYECSPDSDHNPPIGRPISNTKVYILDTHESPVPIGVAGEMFIGGAGVARGYLNHPVLTAERFIPDPFSTVPGARMYKTGDLARYLPDGNIEFLGRNDFQVKIRGFRIELGEIEKR